MAKNIVKYKTLLLVAILAAVAVLMVQHISFKNKIRQVILISIDTCRADFLSCYGCPRKTSPNIDAIAAESLLFENVVASSVLTLPSHSSMLTGTIPPYHGVRDNSNYQLADSNRTLAEIMTENGYKSAAFVSSFVMDSQFGLDQGFELYDDMFYKENEADETIERPAGETTENAISWIEKNKERQFFLFLHYYDPHFPYNPPEPFKSANFDNLYAGEISYTDHCIGKVINKLKDLGLYDSSLIIITSDHGESLGSHGEVSHGYFIYQDTLHVPLVIKSPKGQKGLRISKRTGLIDIVPTVCDLFGITTPKGVSGKSLMPYFANKTMQERPFYCESFLPSVYNCNPLYGLVSEQFKYIHSQRSELYDLTQDPKELNNIIETLPKRVHLMHEILKDTLKTQSRRSDADSEITLDSKSRDRLNSLGYVDTRKVKDSLLIDNTKDDPKDLIEFHTLYASIPYNFTKGDHSYVKNTCEKLLKMRPSFTVPLRYLAKIAHEKGDSEKSLHYYSEYLKTDPNNYEIRYNKAQLLFSLGDTDKAIENLNRVLKINDQYALAYNYLGLIFKSKNNLEKSAYYYSKTIDFDPENIDAHAELGFVLAMSGRTDEAITHFNKALTLKPDNSEVLVSLGMAYIQKGRVKPALEAWNKAVAADTKNADAYNNIGWTLAVTKDQSIRNPQKALEMAKKACELTEFKKPDYLDTLAVAFAANGDFTNAVQTAEKAMKLAVENNLKQEQDNIKQHLELFQNSKPYIE